MRMLLSTLFRFEDRYGMCILFDRLHKYITGVTLSEDGYFIENSLGIPGTLKIDSNFAARLVEDNIDRVVCVFDLDDIRNAVLNYFKES